MFKLPRDDPKYQWTNHVKDKMIYYRISESLVKRIVRFPKRVEEGIAPGTTAAMQPTGSKKRPQEIWVMYRPSADIEPALSPSSLARPPVPSCQKASSTSARGWAISAAGLTSKLIIISCWRYPGTSPVGKPIPIPEDILQELNALVD